MTTQMIIRIDDGVKSKLGRLARNEGKTTSELVRELIENHIRERDISGYIDDLWGRIGAKLSAKGAQPETIQKAVEASRKRRG